MTNGTMGQSAPMMGMQPAPPYKPRMSMMAIVLLVGGVLLMVAFFLPMVSKTMDLGTYGGNYTVSGTGLQLGGGRMYVSSSYMSGEAPMDKSFPIFYGVIVMGIMALVFALLKSPSFMPLLGGIFGIVGTVLAFVGYTQVTDWAKTNGGGIITLDMGIGLILAIVGGVVALVGGLMAFMQYNKTRI